MDILGAVAAGLQLSGLAIKGSIKGLQVLKSLKEVPQQIQNLRDHLDKEHKSISRLVHSDSSLFHHLSADQYGRISLPATRALRAIEDIQALLEPFDSLLQNTTEHGLRGGASRAHKRFLALYKEKDIETKLGDLDRLRDCLNSELQFSVLETQLQTHQTIGAIDRNVSTTQSTIAQIQSSQSHALLQLDKLDAIQRDLRVYESSLHGVNELMPSVLEIRGMMMTFMSQQSASQDGQPSTNQASEFDLDTRRGTARLSTSLIPPSDDVYRDTTDISLPRRRQSRCRCGRIQPEIRWKLGRTKFLMNTGSHANCPVHGKRRSWGVSLEMRLSHFLRGRLALNLGLTCGSMGWEIPIPLKFSAAVERSKSPIFRLLDDLIAKNCTIYKLGNDAEWHSNHEGGKFGLFFGDDSEARFLQWEAAADSSSLASLVQNVKEVVRSGEALGNEYDEAGSNFFTEVIRLAILIDSSHGVSDKDINSLVELIEVAYVLEVGWTAPIPWIISDPVDGHLVKPESRGSLNPLQWLIWWSAARNRHFYYWNPKRLATKEQTLYHRLRGGLRDDTVHLLTMPSLSSDQPIHSTRFGYSWVNTPDTRAAVEWMQIFLLHPELAEAMEFDDLCLAIIRRSLPTVRRLLAAEYTESRNYPGELNPVSLSVGWPEGLTIIVKHGFDVYSALEFACQLDDVQSASILLTSERAIFKDMWTLKATRNNTRIFALVVAELRNCREAVKSLALQNLTMSEQNAVGLTHALQHDDLDLPPELFTVLSKKMRVSEKLDCLRMRSPYCYCYAWSERSPDSAHILYDAGFTNLDTPCMHGKPPLAVCSRQSILDWSSYDDEWRGLCLWILEKGAQDLGPPHPPFMFYVAFWYRRRHVSPYLDTERLRHLKNWFIRDKCNCFCSTYGCIAPFWLWRCCIGGDSYFHMECKSGHLGRYSNLREWIKTSRASKKATEFCYSEIMRLEIFERLGMAHTCCKAHDADESEQQEFREEDRASQRQLQFFCKVYQNLRIRLSDWPIDRFWADWWQAVDLILPPLSPWESCNDFYGRYDPVPVALERDREDFMEKSLSEAGFGGWDFDDVILHQLNRLLQSARAWRGRRRCWQSHRLMAKPTMQLSGCRASREWKQYSCYNIYIPVRTSSEVSSSVGF